MSESAGYQQAIDFLFSRINYERLNGHSYSAGDFKLDRMRELLERLGNPQLRAPVVHVAGTKGKGSTCAMLAAVLTAAGYRTGLYTSPHITVFEERMRVDGEMPSHAELINLVNRIRPVVAEMDAQAALLGPTYFELATALAWMLFADRQCTAVVLETGLGGRLDSTNVCQPALTLVTNVSRDHMHLLGETVELIAAEKAGIIKPQIPLISGSMNPAVQQVMARVAREKQASVIQRGRDYDLLSHQNQRAQVRWQNQHLDLPSPLLGLHQAENTATVAAAIMTLRSAGWSISDDALERGLSSVRWPGRIEVLRHNPTVVIDAAHNWESIKALLATLDASFPGKQRILVFAATHDKDVAGLMRQLLPRFETIILTRYIDNPRGVAISELENLAWQLDRRPVHTAPSPREAWNMARQLASPHDLIVITGSFFLVSELRGHLLASC